MKKIFFVLFFGFFFNGNAYANKPVYVELICAPDTEWEGIASKNKKIWFPSFQAKFVIHMDLEEMKVVKIGYSKNEDEIRDVSIPIEKDITDTKRRKRIENYLFNKFLPEGDKLVKSQKKKKKKK